MEEQWKPVVGFEDRYEVSDLGSVRTIPRYDIRNNGRGTQYKSFRKSIFKAIFPERRGYACVELFDIRNLGAEKCSSKKVHILVMEAFVGPRPEGYHIDHINRNKMDARLCNLEYVTPRENYARGTAGEQRPDKSCKLRGVIKCKKSGKYLARKAWGIDGKTERFHLGTYETPEEAHAAYQAATYEHAKFLKEHRAKDPLGAFGRINWMFNMPSIRVVDVSDDYGNNTTVAISDGDVSPDPDF